VRCRFLVYRNHLDDEETLLVGKREDVLRRVGDEPHAGFRLARRAVFVDQSVLLAKNLTFLV
jgi:3-phenylpropionate/cinnamic acid dioxygenase small subunit